MRISDLQSMVASGEDSSQQFKLDVKSPDSLAAEMAALANCDGGKIILGVSDSGQLVGLEPDDLQRVNQLISSAASQHVRSPLAVFTENIALQDGKTAIIISVPKGLDKPYFDRNGVIWLKVGSDKRKVNSKEELRRLFQMSSQFHGDELPTRAGIEALDRIRFRDFIRDKYRLALPARKADQIRLLRNLNLASETGNLNLAGLLLFAEQPQLLRPEFSVKAISYTGKSVSVSSYEDWEEFNGPFQSLFDGTLAFILRNLRKVQGKGGINSPGIPEIPRVVFEELLVNALVHRDYLVSAPIRVFNFEDRIEIISPGCLPNNLTVEKILAGNSNLRNPILASFVAKGLLPYSGLGTGVPRVFGSWPKISFFDDRDGNLFKVTVLRNTAVMEKPQSNESVFYRDEGETNQVNETIVPYLLGVNLWTGTVKGEIDLKIDPLTEKVVAEKKEKNSKRILALLHANPRITILGLSMQLGVSESTIERSLKRLQSKGSLRRVGPDKGGHWEVLASR